MLIMARHLLPFRLTPLNPLVLVRHSLLLIAFWLGVASLKFRAALWILLPSAWSICPDGHAP